MHAGDVVRIPPDVKHWHGATATSSVTRLAVQEELDGKNVNWLEKVSDQQYPMKTNLETTATPAKQPGIAGRKVSPAYVRSVAPALENYTEQRLFGEVWERPGLSRRDRSVVTVAALIARNQTSALPSYLNQALENGVQPRELSEIITHLAFYSGWGNAFGAIGAAREVFDERGVGADQLPVVSPALLRLDEAAEAKRKETVGNQFGAVAPGVVQLTTDVLFRDLWLRPDLAPRDRSLVTVSALVASGQTAQITYHLNRAMDNGLTQEQAGEVFTQLAFYAGWPNVFSTLPVAKEVFEKRAK